MLFEKMVKAQDEGDVNSWRECLHDDWEFLMHSPKPEVFLLSQ